MSDRTPPALTLQPMMHVRDMASAVDFLTRLGGTLRHGSDDGDWALVEIAGSQLSLLAHPPNPAQNEGIVELNFEAGAPLEEIEASLRDAGIAIAAPISEQGFGRQLQITTPDGLLIKINEFGPPPAR